MAEGRTTAVLWRSGPADEHFLHNLSTPLRVNADWRPLTLPEVVRGSLWVSVELAVTVLFVLGVLAMLYDVLEPVQVCVAVAAVAGGGTACFALLCEPIGWAQLARSCVALLSIVYALTPVLASLAQPISDDTVVSVTGMLLLLHVVSFDYFASSAAHFRAPVAVNSGLLAGIFLCSRMPSYGGVLAVVGLSLVLFALWPPLMLRIRAAAPLSAAPVLAALLGGTCLFCLFFFSRRLDAGLTWTAPGLLGVLVVLNLLLPLLFQRLQSRRHAIDGQWTEAHPR